LSEPASDDKHWLKCTGFWRLSSSTISWHCKVNFTGYIYMYY
jgi:hypothetical protein